MAGVLAWPPFLPRAAIHWLTAGGTAGFAGAGFFLRGIARHTNHSDALGAKPEDATATRAIAEIGKKFLAGGHGASMRKRLVQVKC